MKTGVDLLELAQRLHDLDLPGSRRRLAIPRPEHLLKDPRLRSADAAGLAIELRGEFRIDEAADVHSDPVRHVQLAGRIGLVEKEERCSTFTLDLVFNNRLSFAMC